MAIHYWILDFTKFYITNILTSSLRDSSSANSLSELFKTSGLDSWATWGCDILPTKPLDFLRDAAACGTSFDKMFVCWILRAERNAAIWVAEKSSYITNCLHWIDYIRSMTFFLSLTAVNDLFLKSGLWTNVIDHQSMTHVHKPDVHK